MKLTDNQKIALIKSIEHWRRHALGTSPESEGINSDDCALCKNFFRSRTTGLLCFECPVALTVNEAVCKGTPYKEAHFAFNTYGRKSPQFKEAAVEEVRFLVSILPENERDQFLKDLPQYIHTKAN